MLESINTIKRDGFTAAIHYDESPSDPGDDTQVGTLAYRTNGHGAYGDMPADPYGSGPFMANCPRCSGAGEVRPEGPLQPIHGYPDALSEHVRLQPEPDPSCYLCEGYGELLDGAALARELHGAVVCLPVRAWDDRNGTELRIAESWSDAQGWIYATPASVADTLGADATEEQIIAALRSELDQLQQWAQGEVFGIVVTDRGGRQVDSVWGIYGDDYAEEEASRMLGDAIAAAPSAAVDEVRRAERAFRESAYALNSAYDRHDVHRIDEYPSYLPSFDELVADMSEIRGHVPEETNA